jgi:NDP-sugar pyrophosphorylase family protein
MSNLKTIFVLCGGKGTRFKQISSTTPKILASIKNRPFLEILVQQAIDAGYERIIFLLGHLSEVIITYLKNTNLRNKIILEYSKETYPLGTGGAVRYALFKYPDVKNVAIINGDTYWADGLPIRPIPVRDCISVFSPGYPHDSGGIMCVESRALEFHEYPIKGDYASAGMIWTNRERLLETLPDAGNLEKSFFPIWIDKYQPNCIYVAQLTDFGVPERYRQLNSGVLPDPVK